MSHAPVIALLGGGQLGRMFIENALRYNVEVHVLDPDPHAPCARLAHRFVVGDLNDRATVLAFAENADVVGIEIEHVNVQALLELKRSGKRVIPDPEVLRIIQDKGLQKQFYTDHDIPTAEFVLLENGTEISGHEALLPAFLKSRTGGYDGKGVMPIGSAAVATNGFTGPSVLERKVQVEKEFAVLVVRAHDGNTIAYDPVEMVFDERLNLVDHLRAPARSPDKILSEAKALSSKVAQAFGAPGVYAIELFLTKDGRLLVNETAPRAHNSGHHTIEACASSQFDQLLRCYLELPLGDPELIRPAAMFNLVGSNGEGEPLLEGAEAALALGGTFIHLYGKQRTRNGRKMGHITVMGSTGKEVDRKLEVVRQSCRVVPR